MKVIVLGGGADQCTLIELLKKRGAYVVLADYYSNPPAKNFADKHHQISTLDAPAVLALARAEKPDYVLTACIDQALLTAAWVSEQLDLPFYLSHETALKVSNKAHMKQVFRSHAIPTPRSIVVTSIDERLKKTLQYPVVIKPADANGSFGVTKVTCEEEVRDALERALQISRSRTAIVDEYVPGDEISVDAYVNDGTVSLLLHTRSTKLTAAPNCFPIHRSLFPSGLSESAVAEVETIAARIAEGFGLTNTPLIIQLINGPEGLRVIEFGARIAGGSKHHLINRLTGCDIMEAFVSMALGERPVVKPRPGGQFAATTYIYGHCGVFQELRSTDALLHDSAIDSFYLYKTPGMSVQGFSASRDRIGAFISTATTQDILAEKLATAETTLQVIDSSGRDIMLRPPDTGRGNVGCPT